MTGHTSPCRYLTLLDRFLEGIPPQEIQSIEIPTLEEVSQTLGTQDALWVDQALASAPSEYWFNCSHQAFKCIHFAYAFWY